MSVRKEAGAASSGQCYSCMYSAEYRKLWRSKINYHRFPRDRDRCLAWIENGNFAELLNVPSEIINKTHYLCNRHFSAASFVNIDKSPLLVWDAIPTIFQNDPISKVNKENKSKRLKCSEFSSGVKNTTSKTILCSKENSENIHKNIKKVVDYQDNCHQSKQINNFKLTNTHHGKHYGNIVTNPVELVGSTKLVAKCNSKKKPDTHSSKTDKVALPNKITPDIAKEPRYLTEKLHLNSSKILVQMRHGLYNAGNTCFINAALQALFWITVFREAALAFPACHPPTTCPYVSLALQKTFVDMSASGCQPIMPIEILRCRADINPKLQLGVQDDVLEFLLPLLRILAVESTTQAETLELFTFDDFDIVVCSCGNKSYLWVGSNLHLITPITIGDEPVYDLEKEEWATFSSVNDAVQNLFAEHGGLQRKCPSCGLQQNHTTAKALSNFPDILCVQLLRYVSVAGPAVEIFSIKNRIQIDPVLTLTSSILEGEFKYDLVSTVCHIGTDMTSGHYICQVPCSSNVIRTFDDTHVSCDATLDEKNCYILFYRRRAISSLPENITVGTADLPKPSPPTSTRSTIQPAPMPKIQMPQLSVRTELSSPVVSSIAIEVTDPRAMKNCDPVKNRSGTTINKNTSCEGVELLFSNFETPSKVSSNFLALSPIKPAFNIFDLEKTNISANSIFSTSTPIVVKKHSSALIKSVNTEQSRDETEVSINGIVEKVYERSRNIITENELHCNQKTLDVTNSILETSSLFEASECNQSSPHVVQQSTNLCCQNDATQSQNVRDVIEEADTDVNNCRRTLYTPVASKLFKNRKKIDYSEKCSKSNLLKVKSVISRSAREKVSKKIDLAKVLHNFGVVRKSDLTPRRREVYETMCGMKRDLTYYASKAEKLRGDLNVAEKSKYNSFYKLVQESLPSPMSEIIMKQIEYRGETEQEAHGHRWTEAEKASMLAIYKKSPASYSSFACELKLPSPATLQRLLSNFKLNPGYNKCLFEHAGFTTKDFEIVRRLIAILFDETRIKRHLSVNLIEGQIDGFVDYGVEEGERLPEIATVALIFLAQSLNGEWKLILQFCYAKSATPGLILKRMLLSVIVRAREQRLVVMAVSCDQGGANRLAYRLLGATYENPVFLVDDEPIVAFFDANHLIKSWRRVARSNALTVRSTKPQWTDLIQTYMFDKKQPVKLLSHLRLDKHFYFNNHEAMRVLFAVQVLGNKMSVSLKRRANKIDKTMKRLVKPILKLPVGEQVQAMSEKRIPSMLEHRDRLLVTSDVVRKLDRMHDSLNSSNKRTETKALRRPVSKDSEHAQVWEESIEFLKTWEVRDNQKRDIPCRKNTMWTLRGMQYLSNVLQDMHIKEFYSRSVQTDGLENYNGVIKNIAGDDSPTTPCFVGAVKTSILSNKKVPIPKNRNCEEDSSEVMSDTHFLLNCCQNEEIQEIFVQEKIVATIPEVSSETLEVSMYVCKDVLKKLLPKNVCPDCKNSVTEECKLKRADRKLLEELERNTVPNMDLFPTIMFAKYFFYCSDFVSTLLPERAHRRKLFDFLSRIVNGIYRFDGMGCPEHEIIFRQKFIKEVIIWCAVKYCKEVNVKLKEDDAKENHSNEMESEGYECDE